MVFKILTDNFFVKPVELLNQAWSKSELKHLSPNTLHLIKRFNQLSAWAATAVVWQTKIADRVQVWEKLIELTEVLIYLTLSIHF